MNRFTMRLMPVVAVAALLGGCSSAFNTAGSSEYGCPGMPTGVLCKTPAAVYKSTHLDPEPTEFDLPIGAGRTARQSQPEPRVEAAMRLPVLQDKGATAGPKPVREPSRVARIWIAPWVDKQDNLHLAQIHFTEIKPRTWTVGKPEVSAGSSYVIPHKAFEKIEPPERRADPQAPRDQPAPPPGQSAAAKEAESLTPPTN